MRPKTIIGYNVSPLLLHTILLLAHPRHSLSDSLTTITSFAILASLTIFWYPTTPVAQWLTVWALDEEFTNLIPGITNWKRTSKNRGDRPVNRWYIIIIIGFWQRKFNLIYVQCTSSVQANKYHSFINSLTRVSLFIRKRAADSKNRSSNQRPQTNPQLQTANAFVPRVYISCQNLTALIKIKSSAILFIL